MLTRIAAPLALFAVFVAAGAAACGGDEAASPPTPAPTVDASATPAAMTLTSEAFENGGAIPEEYSCYGQNVSPPLAWSDPEGTESLVLLVDDPAGPIGNLNMWVLYNLPPSLRSLDGRQPEGPTLKGGEQGFNNTGARAYLGPCPPNDGSERTISFRIYALNTKIRVFGEPFSSRVEPVMQGHILAEGRLTGTYAYQADQSGG